MRGRFISDVVSHGHNVCLFCALRPRPSNTLRTAHIRRQVRQIASSAVRTQASAAAARKEDDDDDEDFSMLKQNAALSAAFPTRQKPAVAPPQDNSIKDSSSTYVPPQQARGAPRSFPKKKGGNFGGQRDGSTPDAPEGRFRIRRFAASGDSTSTQSPIDERSQSNGQSVRPNNFRNSSGRNESHRPVRESPLSIRRVQFEQPGRTPPSSSLRDEAIQRHQNPSINQSTFGLPKTKVGAFPDQWRRTEERGSNDGDRRTFPEQRNINGLNIKRTMTGHQDLLGPQDSRTINHQPLPNARDPFPRRTLGQGQPYRLNESGSGTTKSVSPAAEVEIEDAVEVDVVEAPAGSSFDSLEQESRRRARKEQRKSRSERFADPDEEPETNTANRPRSTKSLQDVELAQVEELLYGDGGRKKKKGKAQVKAARIETRPSIRVPEFLSVERLARLLKINTDQLIQKLEEEGFEGARYDHVLDSATSAMFVDLYGFEPIIAGPEVADLKPRPAPEDASLIPSRPPIVTIMGHVDHGKTTILDYLRKSSVVATEHGGITQHIGAFSVTMPGTNRQITFLDTPGHAAFLEMRRRGANVTDIVILVVAADDSVKPQTIEAIKHALAANVQLIVAINKIDKQDADIERVKQDLTRHGIVVEDYGGDYQVVPVSGKTGQGMDTLEEAILTLADVSDFRAEIDGPAEGWVLESKVTQAGRVSTVLVRRGTLRVGDFIVAGTTWARVRTLRNDAGALVTEAPPGTPVQVDGWRAGDPSAGLEVLQAENEDHAKQVMELRLEQEETAKTATDLTALNNMRSEEAEARSKILSWEAEQDWAKNTWGQRPKDNEGWVEAEVSTGQKQVPFIVKADVAGSVEAVAAAVAAIGNNEIAAHIIHSAVGELTESDIRRLAATGETGFAVNFNQPVDGVIARLAEAANLKILDHNIIYKVTDDVRERMADELPPIITQKVTGEAEIGQVFDVTMKKSKVKVAGCRVTNGTINRTNPVRVIRKGETVYTGTLHSLKNVKRDVTEMRKGSECGMGFENWDDFAEGDQIQCFEETKEKRTLY